MERWFKEAFLEAEGVLLWKPLMRSRRLHSLAASNGPSAEDSATDKKHSTTLKLASTNSRQQTADGRTTHLMRVLVGG